MAFPADNFLPVLSVVDDSPPGSGIGFYKCQLLQINGVVLMLNERRTIVGLSAVSSFSDPSKIRAVDINALRDNVEECFPFYVNQNVAIEGQPTYSVWNLATMLTAISGGVGGDWTRIPARNTYGFAASGGDLVLGDSMYKEHVNELISALDQLRVIWFIPTVVQKDARSGTSSVAVTCPANQVEATANWNANSWVSSPANQVQQTAIDNNIPTVAVLSSVRGKIQADLSAYSSGTVKVYLNLGVVFTGHYEQTPPTTAPQDCYGEWTGAGMVVGSLQTTGYIGDSIPLFSMGCTGGFYSSQWVLKNVVPQLGTISGITWTYHL